MISEDMALDKLATHACIITWARSRDNALLSSVASISRAFGGLPRQNVSMSISAPRAMRMIP